MRPCDLVHSSNFASSDFALDQESESVLQNRISGLSSASSMSEVADLLSNLNARVASLTQWQEGTQQAITRYLTCPFLVAPGGILGLRRMVV